MRTSSEMPEVFRFPIYFVLRVTQRTIRRKKICACYQWWDSAPSLPVMLLLLPAAHLQRYCPPSNFPSVAASQEKKRSEDSAGWITETQNAAYRHNNKAKMFRTSCQASKTTLLQADNRPIKPQRSNRAEVRLAFPLPCGQRTQAHLHGAKCTVKQLHILNS